MLFFHFWGTTENIRYRVMKCNYVAGDSFQIFQAFKWRRIVQRRKHSFWKQNKLFKSQFHFVIGQIWKKKLYTSITISMLYTSITIGMLFTSTTKNSQYFCLPLTSACPFLLFFIIISFNCASRKSKIASKSWAHSEEEIRSYRRKDS